MSRPTHPLKHEHRVIEQAMRALEGMCLRMSTGENVPDADLSKALDFILTFIDQHHHGKEEKYLFPTLEQVGVKSENGPLAFLRREHELERQLLEELKQAAADYRQNYAAKERFISAAHRFKDHLIEHMQQEDAILFRMAEEILDPQTKASLAKTFEELNTGAAEFTRRYESIATELERNWAI